MTVKELKKALNKFPEDLQVLYRCCSEYEVLEAEEIELLSMENKEIIKSKKDGRYMKVHPSWVSPEEAVEYVTVVVFPGN